jgi:Mg2+/Co2+ transporter CorC
VEALADGAFRITARLPVEELGELFGIELDDEDVDTVGGLLAKARSAGCRSPAPQVEVDGLSFVAESTEGRRRRIGTVLVREVPAEPAQD